MTLLSWITQYGNVMALLLPVFVCGGVGAVWALKKKSYPREFISTLVTSATTPALVFHTLLTTQLNDALLLQILTAALLALAVMACFAAILLYLARLPVSALLPTATFPNAGNLGLPVAQLAFGETGLTVAVTIFAIFSLVQHTLAVWLLTWAGRATTTQQSGWPRGVAVACIAAVGLRLLDFSLPAPVLASARLVGSLTVPLMLLSLGYALATVSRSSIGSGSVVGVIRLAAGAIAGITVTSLIDLPPLIAGVVVLQLLMPVAVVSYLYTERYTNAGEISAGAILVSTALFLIFSPLLIGWAGATPLG
ncbi:MAG TPA: AEC family transporter [Eoetvoesiella sp.]